MQRIILRHTYDIYDIIRVPEEIYVIFDNVMDDFYEWSKGVSFRDDVTDARCAGINELIWYINDRFSNDWEKVTIESENLTIEDLRLQRLLKSCRVMDFD